MKTDDLIESVTGRVIQGGEINDDGLHLFLDDGRILIVVEGIVYVGRFGETLQ